MILERAKLIDKAIPNPQLQFVLLRDNLVWWGDENGNIISNKVPC
jgi:hypothetical protein